MANLEKIECNVLDAVLLRLLVCKDEKSAELPGICSYPKHKNEGAVKLACNFKDKLVQMYIKLDRMSVKSRSCVITFVEGQYLSRTDELLEILQNSVLWLDIKNENPYFYIFYWRSQYGLIPRSLLRLKTAV
jgi:hypothetical protein